LVRTSEGVNTIRLWTENGTQTLYIEFKLQPSA
jgi:hypothetical protein